MILAVCLAALQSPALAPSSSVPAPRQPAAIELEDVRIFRSQRRFGVSIEGIGPIQGRIRIDSERVIIVSDNVELEYDRQLLVAVTVSAERERDKWSGDLALGINVRKGNSDIIEYNMLAGIERRTPSSRVLIDYLGNFNETDDQRIANNHRVNGTWAQSGATRPLPARA